MACRDNAGQAVIEYILMLSAIVAIYASVLSFFGRFGLEKRLVAPITQDFAKTYQFGDPKAAGFDDGDPKRHPRIQGCEDCFRLFINPEVK
jgi:hypothetical protein